MFFFLLICSPAAAESIDFKFEIPTIPFPPQIANVQHVPPCVGQTDFQVTAEITGQAQKKAVCDIIPREDCTASDWYQIDDPEIVPNPPEIKAAWVHYYYDGNPTDGGKASMTYNAGLGKWEGEVPMKPGAEQGDSITYYVSAVDGRGNVASQTPSTGEEPCPDIESWDDSLATPLMDSCSYATGYSECNENRSYGPGNCGAGYTLGDKAGDVCGEPDGNGVQSLISGEYADLVDIRGVTAGAGGTVFCTKIGLGAPPPGSNHPAPIEGYLMIFFNPDIIDPNPADTHITNAYAVTYAPEASGSDPTLVKVLWSGDCVTNPNTDNPLDCKLLAAGTSDHPKLKIGYQNGSLRIMTNKSGTGEIYATSYSLIGASSVKSVLIAITGEINLSGGTAFWISDLTPGFAYSHKNQSVTILPASQCTVGPCVNITSTLCSPTGAGGAGPVCPHSETQSAQNVCSVSFTDTGAVAVSQYRIYRAPKGSAAPGELAGTITGGGPNSAHTYNNSITTLDGASYDYYIACFDGVNETATAQYPQTYTQCTVDDWTPPAQPAITEAATPPGADATCRIAWTATGGDPTLKDFLIKRGGQILNPTAPVGKSGDSYLWPDPENLDYTSDYSYTVLARDSVNNTSESAAATCRPRDLKAPCQVDEIVMSAAPTSGTLGATLDWQACPDSDTAGYNAYACQLNGTKTNCTTQQEYKKLNSGLVANPHIEDESPDNFPSEAWYRFFVESCDNCTDRAACDARNCTGFPVSSDDFTDHFVSPEINTDKPHAPGGVAAAAPAMGKSCSISWSRVCSDTEGTFEDCDNPTSDQLVGYKIMRQQSPGVLDPNAGTPVATIPAGGTETTLSYTDAGLANGVPYYYKVYAMDGARNYSEGAHQEVSCTPARTTPPALPAMKSLTGNEFSCALDWDPVSDPYAITYEAHRCDGKMDACTTAAQFTRADETGASGISGTEYTDNNVVEGEYYTYCIVANAEEQVKSAVYDAANKRNCGQCFAGETLAPPTDVTAWFEQNDYTVKVSFVRSVSEQGGGGYSLYRCADSGCAEAGRTRIKACSELAETSSAIRNIGMLNPLSISGEPEGEHYYGAAYQSDCSAGAPVSELHNVGTAISEQLDVLAQPCGSATKCVVLSSCSNFESKTGCSPVTRRDTTQTTATGYALAPQQGFEVFLADRAGNPVGGAVARTGADGNYKLSIDTQKNPLDLGAAYQLILKLPDGAIPGQPCSSGLPGDGCLIELNKNVTVKEDSTVTQVRGIPLADCGGGEIGNFNCDATVDISDVILLKNCFGSSAGEDRYKTWCDVNGNGVVDVSDFIAIKNHFGLELDAAPSCPAAMCREK